MASGLVSGFDEVITGADVELDVLVVGWSGNGGGVTVSVRFSLLRECECCLSDHKDGTRGIEGTNEVSRSLSVFVDRALD